MICVAAPPEVSLQFAENFPGGLVAVHFGHLTIHENNVIFFPLPGLSTAWILPLGDDMHEAAEFLQLFHGHELVDQVVFRQQDADIVRERGDGGSVGRGRLFYGSAGGRFLSGERQSEPENGSFSKLLLMPMVPPINSTSFRQMASPKPVPPNRRVVDVSA